MLTCIRGQNIIVKFSKHYICNFGNGISGLGKSFGMCLSLRSFFARRYLCFKTH